MYKPVSSKKDFVKRFLKNEFGNRGPNWHSLEDFLQSGYTGLVHLRSRHSAGKGKYNVPAKDVVKEVRKLKQQRSIYLAAMAPHSKGTIQGNVQVFDGSTGFPAGLVLEYNQLQLPMREAFKQQSLLATGIIASTILRTHLCPNSYDWLQILLCRYPGHVVEFSAFSVQWGTLAGFNTAFWEVRSY